MNLCRHLFCADAGSNKAYKDAVAKGEIEDTSSCKTAYTQFDCVSLAGMLSAAPCDSKGAPMLPCYEMCTDIVMQCSPNRPQGQHLKAKHDKVSGLLCYLMK